MERREEKGRKKTNPDPMSLPAVNPADAWFFLSLSSLPASQLLTSKGSRVTLISMSATSSLMLLLLFLQ